MFTLLINTSLKRRLQTFSSTRQCFWEIMHFVMLNLSYCHWNFSQSRPQVSKSYTISFHSYMKQVMHSSLSFEIKCSSSTFFTKNWKYYHKIHTRGLSWKTLSVPMGHTSPLSLAHCHCAYSLPLPWVPLSASPSLLGFLCLLQIPKPPVSYYVLFHLHCFS